VWGAMAAALETPAVAESLIMALAMELKASITQAGSSERRTSDALFSLDGRLLACQDEPDALDPHSR